MTEFNRTLYELWKEAGEKPFRAARIDEANIYSIYGPTIHNPAPYFIGETDIGTTTLPGCRYGWRLHVEKPKPVPHWPAVCDINGTFKVLDSLFSSEARGREVFKGDFIRLATEYPPILLVPEKK